MAATIHGQRVDALRGRVRGVRGGRSSKANPRLFTPPPSDANPRASHSAAPLVLSRPDVTVTSLSLYDILAGTSQNPAPSKFGGTTLERAADNAAKMLGWEFDAAQWVVDTVINGSYTVIDRVLFHPRTAVYLDGIQHQIREAADPQDMLQKLDLESQGWIVIRITEVEMRRDPLGSIQQVLYAQ